MKVAENAYWDLTNIARYLDWRTEWKNNQHINDDIYSLFLFISEIVPGPYGLQSGGHQNSFSLLNNTKKNVIYG